MAKSISGNNKKTIKSIGRHYKKPTKRITTHYNRFMKKKTNKKKHHYKKAKKTIKRVFLKSKNSSHKRKKYSKARKMRGGMVSSPAASPVGYSWNGGSPDSWPGVEASKGLDTKGSTMSNHFAVSPNGIVTGGIIPMKQSAGKKGKSKKGKKQHGGFFQEIQNLGRGTQYSANTTYYDFIGKNPPLGSNPYPTQQPINVDYKYIGQRPVDVRKIYIDANNTVAKI